MPRKEKSFFGKIMGGDVTDVDLVEEETVEEEPTVIDDEDLEDLEDEDDIEDLEDEEDYVEAPIPATTSLDDEADEEEETEVAVSGGYDEPEPVAVASAAVSQKDEEWMNDYEGALNIDMYQTKDNVIIKSTIAGVRPDDIDITVANDMVTIKGSRSREEKITQDDYFYQECYWGSFSRSVIVPVDIDSEEIEADLKDGILTIIIPKAAKAKTKKVKVKGL
jgi:HSP20 family protein